MIRTPSYKHERRTNGPSAVRRSRRKMDRTGQHRFDVGSIFIGVFAAMVWVMWPIFSILLAAAAIAYLLDPIIAETGRPRGRQHGDRSALFSAASRC